MTYKPNLNDHWKLRAIAATRGTTTMMGAVVLAILNHKPSKPPYFQGLAHIDKFGMVWGRLRGKGQLFTNMVRVGTVQEYTDELKRLADACQMDDSEAKQLMAEGRMWIERDDRAKSRLN